MDKFKSIMELGDAKKIFNEMKSNGIVKPSTQKPFGYLTVYNTIRGVYKKPQSLIIQAVEAFYKKRFETLQTFFKNEN